MPASPSFPAWPGGIDGAAHEGSLATGTVAVIAGGIDVIYPYEHRDLYAEIAARGAVVCENAPGTPTRPRLFPRRNRIVSGLSQAVVVVEATKRSGSLITARLGGEQGRDVFAVPGAPRDPRAQGCNSLIRDGAILAESAADIIAFMGTPGTTLQKTAAAPFLHPMTGLIIDLINPENYLKIKSVIFYRQHR